MKKRNIPKLFSDDHNYQSDEMIEETNYQTDNETEKLFDQDIDVEEDFEIPAFLRKQKFNNVLFIYS